MITDNVLRSDLRPDCLKNTNFEYANGQQILESAIDEDEKLIVLIKRWQKDFFGETIVCHTTLTTAVNEAFQTLLPQFQLHHLLKRNEHAMCQKDKERATSEQILVHFGFNQIYQDEVQSSD